MDKKPDKFWTVYMILADSGKVYTGITTDLRKRFSQHASGKDGAKFFRSAKPVEVVWKKRCKGRSRALKLEAQIKRLSRSEKWALIVPKS